MNVDFVSLAVIYFVTEGTQGKELIRQKSRVSGLIEQDMNHCQRKYSIIYSEYIRPAEENEYDIVTNENK